MATVLNDTSTIWMKLLQFAAVVAVLNRDWRLGLFITTTIFSQIFVGTTTFNSHEILLAWFVSFEFIASLAQSLSCLDLPGRVWSGTD